MAFRWRADDGLIIVIFGSSLPSSTKKPTPPPKKKKKKKKKNNNKKEMDPLWKTFWIRVCIRLFLDRHYMRKVRTQIRLQISLLSMVTFFFYLVLLPLVQYSNFRREFLPMLHFCLYYCNIRRHSCTAYNLSKCPAKSTSWHGRPAKTQISLRICAVWSESWMGALWVAKGTKFLQP